MIIQGPKYRRVICENYWLLKKTGEEISITKKNPGGLLRLRGSERPQTHQKTSEQISYYFDPWLYDLLSPCVVTLHIYRNTYQISMRCNFSTQ